MTSSDEKNIAERLSIGDANEGEVALIIQEHFGFAAEETPDKVHYGRPGEPCAIVLEYSKSGRLKKIGAGPGLRDSDVESLAARIKSELRSPIGEHVAREIAFCSVPVTGYYRFDDVQLLPAPAEAPRPPVLFAKHPFVLAFLVRTSANPIIEFARRRRVLRQLVLFLNVVLNQVISENNTRNHRAWVLLPATKDSKVSTNWCQEGYVCESFVHKADDFSKPGEIAQMPVVESQDYFNRLKTTADTLAVPQIIVELYQIFRSLPAKTQDVFLRAAFCYRYASTVARFSSSASFVALISAIEALLPEETNRQKCNSCGQRLGSISSRFSEMLDQLAPGSQLSGDRQKLYGIRSKLSHGGALLLSDEELWRISLHPKESREWQDSAFAYQLTRIAIINWLSSQLRSPDKVTVPASSKMRAIASSGRL